MEVSVEALRVLWRSMWSVPAQSRLTTARHASFHPTRPPNSHPHPRVTRGAVRVATIWVRRGALEDASCAAGNACHTRLFPSHRPPQSIAL